LEGKTVEKRLTFIWLTALAGALTAVMFVAPQATGTQSQRGECQQNCTRQYQDCRRATNANEAACKQAFDACREACKDLRGNQNANTNVNTNTNGNTNTNTNGNTNTNTNGNTSPW
jgi:membrane-associated HD superfamily phosphohydrolase